MKKQTNQSRVVKRKRKVRKRVYIVVIPLLVILIAATALLVRLYMKTDAVLSESYIDDGRAKSDLRDGNVDPKFDNVSVLLMGVDSSDKRENDDSARTDALMVATLNKDDKSVKLVSIPRDSLVYIPEVDTETKINHAHAYGQEQAVIDTVENLLEIPIDYWVKVNFNSFIDVVEALDGVKVNVPYEFTEQDSKDRADAIHLYPGYQTLNGEEALALTRTRKMDNDIARGKRQQEVLKAIVDRTVSLSSIMKLDDVIEAVGKNMQTSMQFSEIKSFISYGTRGKKLDIESITLDGIDYQPGNMYFWKLDELALEETISDLQDHLEFEPRNSTIGDDADEPTTNESAEPAPQTEQ